MPTEPVITDADDERVYKAAKGLRPEFSDDDDLPEGKINFAFNVGEYRVTQNGNGTNVYLFGTTPQKQSICVRAENFEPYFYLSLDGLYKTVEDQTTREVIIKALVDELQARLVAVIALGEQLWSPERQAMRESIAGRLYHNKSENRASIQAPKNHCLPITGWKVIEGEPLRGDGPMAGYAGMTLSHFLQLRMYSPSLVPKARAILRGKFAELGSIEQAYKLSRYTPRAGDDAVAAATTAAKQAPRNKLQRQALSKHQKSISGWNDSAYVIADNSRLDELDDEEEMRNGLDNPEDDNEEMEGGEDEEDANENALLTQASGDPDSDQIEDEQLAVDDDETFLRKQREELLAQQQREEMMAEKNHLHNMDADEEGRQYESEVPQQHQDAVERAQDEIVREITAADRAKIKEIVAARNKKMLELTNGESKEIRKCDAGDEASDESLTPDILTSNTRRYPATEENIAALQLRLEKRFVKMALKRLTQSRAMARSLLDKVQFDIFEADIDFLTRFIVDTGSIPEQWLTVNFDKEFFSLPNGLKLEEPLRVQRAFEHQKETRQDIELHCDYRALSCDEKDPIQNTLPDHTTVALDIETATGARGEFPKSKTESMLQCVFIIKDTRDIPSRPKPPPGKFYYWSISFTLKAVECTSAPRQYCTKRSILCFANETVLFQAMANFVRTLNPQVIVGYNSDSFDLPYMLERAEVLGCGKAFSCAWGKMLRGQKMVARNKVFHSSAAGDINYKEIKATGLETLDLLMNIRKDTQRTERDLSLNAISAKYVGEQKEDVDYKMINTHQLTAIGRELLRVYCEKDALLPMEIIEVLQIVIGLVEQSRINGVTLGMLIKRGLQIRATTSLLIEGIHDQPLSLFYTRTDEEREESLNDSYVGATVVDPIVGYFETPVITLDFASLYPSIAMQFNLCFRTQIRSGYDVTKDPKLMRCADPERELTLEERKKREEEAVYTLMEVDPTSARYKERVYIDPKTKQPIRILRHHIRIGLVPRVLQKKLALRSLAKKDQRKAEDAGDKQFAAVCSARQLNLKLLGNSMYGFLGSTTSRAYTPNMAAAITMRGRAGLSLSKDLVMNEFVYIDPIVPKLPPTEGPPDHPPQQQVMPTAEVKQEPGLDAEDANLIEADRKKNSNQHALIIYGDTDSLFVNLPNCKTVQEAAKMGVSMAKFITGEFKIRFKPTVEAYNVLSLEFEKVYERLAMIAKKKYAGLLWKYAGADDSLTAYPAPGVPTISGLEGKKRDTTLLVVENFIDLVAVLISAQHDKLTNMRNFRTLVWRRLFRPLQEGNVNPHLLKSTKQIRGKISDYSISKAGKKQTAPAHIQLAEKVTIRVGGPDSAAAPRSGDRMTFLFIEGSPGQKISECAETVMYALDNNKQPNRRYYMNSIKKIMLRLLVPMMGGQRKMFGRTEAARLRNVKERASQFLCGHKKDFIDKYADDVREIIPATQIAREKADAKFLQSEKGKLVAERISQRPLPKVDVRTGVPIERPRYRSARVFTGEEHIESKTNADAATEAASLATIKTKPTTTGAPVKQVSRQRNMAAFSAQGVRCMSCKVFFPGRQKGYVCDDCLEEPTAAEESFEMLSDCLYNKEKLQIERAHLVDNCNDCVGKRDAPRRITCKNETCPIFYERYLNLASMKELDERIATLTIASRKSGALPKIILEQDDELDDDEEVHQQRKKGKQIK